MICKIPQAGIISLLGVAPPSSCQSRQGRKNVAHRGSGGYVFTRSTEPRRGGTSLTKNIFKVVVHAMLPKERAKFVLETGLSVVRLLILDVSGYLIEVR
jgi:hypothetical protein